MNQHSKIISLMSDGEWHCKNEIRALYIFNAHKRMIEIEGRKNKQEEPTGKYIFREKRCEHGWPNQKDYLMTENTNYTPSNPRLFTGEKLLQEAIK